MHDVRAADERDERGERARVTGRRAPVRADPVQPYAVPAGKPLPDLRFGRTGNVDREAVERQRLDETDDVGGDPAGQRLRSDKDVERPADNRRVLWSACEPETGR
jgi:hypothetical protein